MRRLHLSFDPLKNHLRRRLGEQGLQYAVLLGASQALTAIERFPKNRKNMSQSIAILERQQAVLDLPLNRHLGIRFDGLVDGVAKAHLHCTPELATFGGHLHGGALSSSCEVTGFLALLPQLESHQHAVTHDIHVSLMRGVPAGARCDLSGQVIRLGKTLAFLDVRASVDGLLVASARITKSIISRP